jgi:bifunctional oligoribonuclease and PAP phosphatase NrnA
MQKWDSFIGLIRGTAQSVVICTHTNPDADAIGSSLAWAAYLQKKGHQATVVVPNECPKNLKWMAGYESVIEFEANANTRKKAKEAFDSAGIICCLDFNSLNRIKEVGALVNKSVATKILIDHHIEPEDFADIVFSDTTKAATAQYIFELIRELGDEDLIDKDMANCLYAGIMTDTGSFRHSSTTPEVHRVVADLMKTGFDANHVHRLIFDNSTEQRMRILGYVLYEKLVILPEFRTAYMSISEEEFKRFQSNMGDTEGIVNYGLEIENIVLAVLVIERKDEVKLSFRSVDGFSVRELAAKYFEGGGHKNASGGRTKLGVAGTIDKLLNILPEYKESLLAVVK